MQTAPLPLPSDAASPWPAPRPLPAPVSAYQSMHGSGKRAKLINEYMNQSTNRFLLSAMEMVGKKRTLNVI